VERRYRITRGCLDVLAERGDRFEVLLLTRSALIEDDLDRLGALPRAHVGVSIPTIDDTVRAHFEPRAAPIERRLSILDALRERGVRTIAVVQPMLPGPVDALADALARSAESVSIDVLRGIESAGPDFADPRYAHCRDEDWQRAQADALAIALCERDVPVWSGELPPDLARVREPTA
jgi:DNA repair photolyase